MKKLKIISTLIIILTLSFSSNVLAKVNDTLFISRSYSDVFAVQEYKNGGHRMYHGLIYYMTKGNKTEIGYCIELGAPLDAVTYSSTSDYTKFGLNKEQSDYINLVAYYGYEYKNHYDRFYYFAAQEIIWEYLTGDEIYWVSAEDYNASRINLDSYKNEIINLVNRYSITPEFNDEIINYGDTIELIDINNVLSDYQVNDIKNGKYNISGNKLTVTSTSLDDIEISFSKKIANNNSETYFYADGSQSIICAGSINNNIVKYTFKNEGVKVKVNKKDAETKENITNSNVSFKLYDIDNSKYIYNENKLEFDVNENGIVILPYLLKGNYRLEEVDNGINNYLYNKEPLKFIVDSNQITYDNEFGYVINVDFYNYKPLGKIEINKKGEEYIVKNDNFSYQEINLDNILFDVITKQDIIYNDEKYIEGEIVATIKTNENGHAFIENLPLGKYIVKEKETNENYILDEHEYEINLEYINAYTDIINKSLNIKNFLKKGSIEITKIDSKTNKPLKGVLIAIYDSNNNKIYESKTDSNGKIKLDNLIYGVYTAKEIAPLNDYKLDNNKYKFELNNDNTKALITIENAKIEKKDIASIIPPKTTNKNNNDILIILTLLSILVIKKIKNMI